MISKKRRTHSKTGCITCKVRKKRCSEEKPVCSDCARLGYTCVYLPAHAAKELVQKHKEQVEIELKKRTAAPTRETVVTGQPSVVLDDFLDSIVTPSAATDLVMPTSPYLSQPLANPVLTRLDPVGVYLYNYYRDYLGQIISIAPTKQNYYLQIFLPMAHLHEGILYGLMAWSAHHLSISLGGAPSQQKSYSTLQRYLSADDEEVCLDESLKDLRTTSEEPTRDKIYASLANQYTLKSLQSLHSRETAKSQDDYLWSLAQILVLCGAEICQGDVNRWKILLRCGTKLIKENADNDITNVLWQPDSFDNKTKYWLLANFIYHDIMCSHGTHFPMDQYNAILNKDASTGNSVAPPFPKTEEITDNYHLDPLHGVNRPIFQILGDVTNLTRKAKRLKLTKRHSQFSEIMIQANKLQTSLYVLRPDPRDLQWYEELSAMNDNTPSTNSTAHRDALSSKPSVRELCLTLFSLFRTTALVHLKTSIFKYPKDSFEIQFLLSQLLTELDVILGTKLESCLCFPLFICGINCIDSKHRTEIELKFDDFIQRYKCRNVDRARVVMRKVWSIDDDSSSVSEGSKEKDWFDVVDDMGWDISFA